MVTGVDALTAAVATEKVAEAAPCATVTLAGTPAAEGLELDSDTAAPPAGAGAVRVIVPVPDWPPTIDAGLTVTPLKAAGCGLMVSPKVELPPA